MQIFDSKGKFTPLSADVLAKFDPEQTAAYDQLASVVAELNAANLEATDAIAANRSALAALREAEAIGGEEAEDIFLGRTPRLAAPMAD